MEDQVSDELRRAAEIQDKARFHEQELLAKEFLLQQLVGMEMAADFIHGLKREMTSASATRVLREVEALLRQDIKHRGGR
jgi:hypothetical protein